MYGRHYQEGLPLRTVRTRVGTARGSGATCCSALQVALLERAAQGREGKEVRRRGDRQANRQEIDGHPYERNRLWMDEIAAARDTLAALGQTTTWRSIA